MEDFLIEKAAELVIGLVGGACLYVYSQSRFIREEQGGLDVELFGRFRNMPRLARFLFRVVEFQWAIRWGLFLCVFAVVFLFALYRWDRIAIFLVVMITPFLAFPFAAMFVMNRLLLRRYRDPNPEGLVGYFTRSDEGVPDNIYHLTRGEIHAIYGDFAAAEGDLAAMVESDEIIAATCPHVLRGVLAAMRDDDFHVAHSEFHRAYKLVARRGFINYTDPGRVYRWMKTWRHLAGVAAGKIERLEPGYHGFIMGHKSVLTPLFLWLYLQALERTDPEGIHDHVAERLRGIAPHCTHLFDTPISA